MPERALAWVGVAAALALIISLAYSTGTLVGETLVQVRLAQYCQDFRAILLDGQGYECVKLPTRVGTTGG